MSGPQPPRMMRTGGTDTHPSPGCIAAIVLGLAVLILVSIPFFLSFRKRVPENTATALVPAPAPSPAAPPTAAPSPVGIKKLHVQSRYEDQKGQPMHYSPGESCNGGEYLRAPGDYHCRMLRDRGEFTLQFRKLGGPGEMVYYFNIQDDQGREWWNTDRGDTDEGCNGCDLRLISFPLSDPTEGMVKILDLDRDGAQEILYFYQFEHQGALYYLDLEWENDQPYFDHHTVRNCACSGNDRPSLETLRRCEFADYRRKLEEICRR